MARVEGWAQRAWDQFAQCADHTYVWCPDNNTYFDCWADSHTGRDQRWIVAGWTDNRILECYRLPTWLPFKWYADTAGIGTYGVDGLCHQSTNCFLFPANRTLNFNVLGYWFSLLTYGTYGRQFYRWLSWPFSHCVEAARSAAAVVRGDTAEAMPTAAESERDPLPDRIRELHLNASRRPVRPDPDEVLIDEVALVTRHHAPEIDPGKFRGFHAAYLKQMESLTRRGFTGEQLSQAINELGVESQKKLRKVLGEEEYQKLMGVEPGKQLRLVEPAGVEAAGKRPPLQSDHVDVSRTPE